ncbi:hypothetical protein [Pelomonas cellulosilytica]|uniref:RHS repeat protein n=1 Tax=Pelomonas cellulosilytica TaxID=2906762 RepID=A0ABS8XU88_9BURK|nr:hypothetical protein [Pelomonas sp. P8]MCE4554264.1 hypothetical protein [Pelomonas sp. P8]
MNRLLQSALMACFALSAATVAAQQGTHDVVVGVPNGYLTIKSDDLSVVTTSGPVRWMRIWDGQEWRFNPHWESLSQSWKNLTGSKAADTTAGTQGGSGGGSTSAGGGSGGGGGGCWVLVDEDWQPSTGTAVIGGVPDAGPVLAARTAPFNRLMGEASGDYPPPVRVNVDFAALCGGASGSAFVDVEGIRRANELYLGESGRYAFDNRTGLEKRLIRMLQSASTAAIDEAVVGGQYPLNVLDNQKGYRWTDRAGDWIDYNVQGQIVSYGDRNDNVVWMLRDTTGKMRAVLDAAGRVVYSLHYAGDLVTEVRDYPVAGYALDLPARSVRYAYDERNRLNKVTDARGNTLAYDYDASNRLIRVIDQEGRVEQFSYQGDTVAKRTAPDGGETEYLFEYDDVNKQFASKVTGPETDAGRRVEHFTHNRVGKLVRYIVNGRTENEVRFDTANRIEISTNLRGFTTRVTRDEFEQVVKVELPGGATRTSKYSPLHLQLTEYVDEAGVKTTYEHDARGNLQKRTEAVGTPEERVTEYETNALGQLVRYTRKGRLEKNGVQTPDASWTFEYNQLGQVKKTTDPEGHIREYVYNRAGELVQHVDPRRNTTTYTVDALGNLLKAVSPTP